MKLRVGAVFIPVLNLEESIKWYSDVLGLTLVDNWGTGASFTFTHGEALVALIQANEIQPLEFTVSTNQNKNVYFHFETDDFSTTKKYLEEKCVLISDSLDHEMMEESYIRDPSGNLISIFCEKKHSPFYNHAKSKISW